MNLLREIWGYLVYLSRYPIDSSKPEETTNLYRKYFYLMTESFKKSNKMVPGYINAMEHIFEFAAMFCKTVDKGYENTAIDMVDVLDNLTVNGW